LRYVNDHSGQTDALTFLSKTDHI